jgi:hypothetical protein
MARFPNANGSFPQQWAGGTEPSLVLSGPGPMAELEQRRLIDQVSRSPLHQVWGGNEWDGLLRYRRGMYRAFTNAGTQATLRRGMVIALRDGLKRLRVTLLTLPPTGMLSLRGSHSTKAHARSKDGTHTAMRNA